MLNKICLLKTPQGLEEGWREPDGAYTNPRLPPYPVAEAGVCVGELMGAYTNPRLPPYPVAEAGDLVVQALAGRQVHVL